MRKPEKHQKNLFPRPATGPKGQRPGSDEEELLSALAPLKPALDAFGEETEEILAGLATPGPAYFTGIVRKALAGARKAALAEALTFMAVAIAFLTGVHWFLQAGYFLPVAVGYGIIALLLPTVILFVPEARHGEVNE